MSQILLYANPSDKAFETLNNYKFNCDKDVFCYEPWCSQGVLKDGKFDDREN